MNENKQLLRQLRDGTGSWEYPLRWNEALPVLQALGFDITPQRVLELIQSGDIMPPVGPSIAGMEFYESDMVAVMDACDRRGWWLPNATQHDRKRTDEELSQLRELRPIIEREIAGAQKSPIDNLPDYIAGLENEQIRRLLLHVLRARIFTLKTEVVANMRDLIDEYIDDEEQITE